MQRTRQAAVMFLAFFLTGLIVSQSAYADIWMKQKHHTDGYTVMGQNVPVKDSVSKSWITKDWMRTDNSDRTTSIVRLDKGLMYMIDHAAKTYMEMPLNIGKATDDAMSEAMKGMSEEQKKYMSSMMKSMMKFSIKITPGSEKKKIGKWNCQKYMQRMDTAMGPVNTELWATPDLKIDYDLMSRYNAIMMTSQPGLRESLARVQNEMKKIKGVPVLTSSSSTVMGASVKSTIELTDFVEGKAPSTINAVPAGYKKKSLQDAK